GVLAKSEKASPSCKEPEKSAAALHTAPTDSPVISQFSEARTAQPPTKSLLGPAQNSPSLNQMARTDMQGSMHAASPQWSSPLLRIESVAPLARSNSPLPAPHQ